MQEQRASSEPENPSSGWQLADGQPALCESSRGAVGVRVLITDELQPGVVSMPHGYGMVDDSIKQGPSINELTGSEHCDDLAKTPFHKCVPVRVRPLSGSENSPTASPG